MELAVLCAFIVILFLIFVNKKINLISLFTLNANSEKENSFLQLISLLPRDRIAILSIYNRIPEFVKEYGTS